MIWFPVVGFLLGAILICVNNAAAFLGFNVLPCAVFLVISLIIITGGLHMDGLADTCDAFLSRKDKEGMLLVMRDSRIGAMGVLGVACVLLMKIALLLSINRFLLPYALVLMCALSRWAMVFIIFCFPYARPEGKAKNFIEGITAKIFVLATGITMGSIVLIGSAKSVIIMAFVAIIAYLVGAAAKKKIGGITGDTLGAANELLEITTLIAVLAVQKGWLL